MSITYPLLQPLNLADFKEQTVISQLDSFRVNDYPAPLNFKEICNKENANIPVLIVCPGPSHLEIMSNGQTRLESLLARNNDQYVILAGAASLLLQNGTIKPNQVDAIIYNNPIGKYLPQLPTAEQLNGIKVFTATHCLPDLFTALEQSNANIIPWHAHMAHIPNLFNDSEDSIGTGFSTTLAAMSLLSAIGHRHFETIGWDGTPFYTQEQDEAPEAVARRREKSTKIALNEKEFLVRNLFANDTIEFIQFIKNYTDAIEKIHVHGETSYNGKILNDQGNPRTDFSTLNIEIK